MGHEGARQEFIEDTDVNTLANDLRYAFRGLRKNPGFSVVATLTIALGIGACTATFSIVNAVLLRPLPYADPGRLMLVWSELRARNVPDFSFPIPDVKDLRERSTSFDAFAGVTPPGRVAIGGDNGDPEQVKVCGVTANMFSVRGARMLAGRDFVNDDGLPQPVPPAGSGTVAAPRLPVVAVLGYNFWQRRYGGDRSIVGKAIDFGNGRAEIVGILAPGFELLMPPRTGFDPAVDIWTALRLNFETAARNVGALRVIGRLKQGVALEQARADLEGIAASLRERFAPKKNANLHIRVVPMHEDLV